MNKFVSWKKLIIGCTVGNILELYDFILYAYFATIIGLLFFPTHNKFVATLLAFSVFATGCLMRPIGAIFFGLIGDRLGRRKALILSVGLMALSTGFIGLLPTYATIGIWAQILLVLSRLLQGLSMCGEEVGAAIYLMESAPQKQRCFAGSIILAGVYLGLMLASVIAFLTIQFTTKSVLNSWGWRIPFVLAIPFGMLALYIRLKQPETKVFKQVAAQHQLVANPVKIVLQKYYLEIIKGILISSLMAVIVYLYAVYLPSYISNHFNFGLSGTMFINMIGFLITTIVCLLAGHLSDKFGYQRIMRIACIATLIFIYPIFNFLAVHTLANALISEFILSVLVGLIAGCLMPFLVNAFPAALRFAGAAIAFNISMTIFGSSAPVILLYLSNGAYSHFLPAAYVMLTAIIALFASTSSKSVEIEETYAEI